jgi:hypothetical protein
MYSAKSAEVSTRRRAASRPVVFLETSEERIVPRPPPGPVTERRNGFVVPVSMCD